MKLVNTVELKNHTNEILRYVQGRQPVVITIHGRPCAALEPITEDDLEELAFAYGLDVRRMARESATDMRRGRYVTLTEYLAGKRTYRRRRRMAR